MKSKSVLAALLFALQPGWLMMTALAAPGQASLIEPFGNVNGTLNGDDVLAIASDGTRGYAGTSKGELYRWTLASPSPTATLVVGAPTVKGAIRDILLDGSNAYLATSGGVVRCSFSGSNTTCDNFTGMGLPSSIRPWPEPPTSVSLPSTASKPGAERV